MTGVGAAGPFRPERALRRLCTFSKPVRRSRRALDSTGSSSELSPPSASGGSAPGSGWSPGPRGCGACWKALAGMSASSCVWGTSADPEPHSSVTAGDPPHPRLKNPREGESGGGANCRSLLNGWDPLRGLRPEWWPQGPELGRGGALSRDALPPPLFSFRDRLRLAGNSVAVSLAKSRPRVDWPGRARAWEGRGGAGGAQGAGRLRKSVPRGRVRNVGVVGG